MGLDTTHDCWHGPYSAFNRWRQAVAKAAGIPLYLMDGFHQCPNATAMEWAAPRDGGPMCASPYGPLLHGWARQADDLLPISWNVLKPDVLHVLLNHSDCDGEIAAEHCAPLADRLEQLLPMLPTTYETGPHEGLHGPETITVHVHDAPIRARQFIDGLRLAASRNEPVGFH